jgi:hypothetical protein
MRCLPILLFFFFTMNQFDSPITPKNETMEAPQDRRFYFEVLSSSPLAHPYGWKEDNNLPKHIFYIKANMVSVCLSVCGDKQGRAGRLGQTPAHNRSFSVTPGKATVVVSVYVGSAWKILPITACSCGASPDVIDSREKRNQGQSDFLRQKIW